MLIKEKYIIIKEIWRFNMEYTIRQYPEFSACGLNCGLCPRYHTDGASKCPGCAAEGFSKVHPTCGVLSCCQRHNLDACYLCAEFPCKKYNSAAEKDSFISHQNRFSDFEKIKKIGLDAYKVELNEKIKILESLLDNYNDGRRQSFFCTAVNLLPLADLKEIMTQLSEIIPENSPTKEKSAAAMELIQATADGMKISLKLKK
jgi:hypothetical protein